MSSQQKLVNNDRSCGCGSSDTLSKLLANEIAIGLDKKLAGKGKISQFADSCPPPDQTCRDVFIAKIREIFPDIAEIVCRLELLVTTAEDYLIDHEAEIFASLGITPFFDCIKNGATIGVTGILERLVGLAAVISVIALLLIALILWITSVITILISLFLIIGGLIFIVASAAISIAILKDYINSIALQVESCINQITIDVTSLIQIISDSITAGFCEAGCADTCVPTVAILRKSDINFPLCEKEFRVSDIFNPDKAYVKCNVKSNLRNMSYSVPSNISHSSVEDFEESDIESLEE